MAAQFKPGDWVIYRKQKVSVHPSVLAKHIEPAPHGEFYSYQVDKFWTVVAVQSNNCIVVCTRRGKQLSLSVNDPALRRARWYERLLFRRRFPGVNATDSPAAQSGKLTVT